METTLTMTAYWCFNFLRRRGKYLLICFKTFIMQLCYNINTFLLTKVLNSSFQFVFVRYQYTLNSINTYPSFLIVFDQNQVEKRRKKKKTRTSCSYEGSLESFFIVFSCSKIIAIFLKITYLVLATTIETQLTFSILRIT